MTDRSSNLLRMLGSAGKEPHSHHDWICAWREMYAELEEIPDSSDGFSEIEQAAIGSLSNVHVTDTHAHLSCEVRRMLNTFKHPTFLVDSEGQISAQNAMVGLTYDLDVGDKISDLPVTIDPAESIKEVIRKVTHSRFAKGKAVFKQARSKGSSHELTLAITQSQHGAGPAVALVFIISSKFGEKATQLIKNHYGLTTAESQILISFVEGYSLKEIAGVRARSYATVRTQFNSLLTKMGANNQAALLRTALSLSDFNSEIEKLSTVLAHPYRRAANIMREGGRMVDLGFCGDPAGIPLLHIATAAQNRFNAQVEESLFNAGLYLITVCPPAHGKTDPQPLGTDRRKCQSEDIEAVLDMLNIRSCPLLVSSAGTFSAFKMAADLPERISHIFLLAASPPGNYWSRHGTGAPWVDAIFRVDEKFAAVRRIVGAANLKALVTLGSKQYHKLQLAGNKKDVETVIQPENVVELEHSLESATTFGMGSILEDIRVLFTDYSELISKSSCKVSIIHGQIDPMFPIQAMRHLQADYPHRMELFEINEAGFTVFLTHTEEVVNLLSDISADTTKMKRRPAIVHMGSG